ncbi:hypothetical protein [Maliponia aquimaris]|uniref:Capsule polysaccharide biosynthesis protein n=1 Tax=Maliponia aquimaris TaxID=1673631 RepID=A0A238KBT0_9RHOB|nr:hypothetical protein [Maliponia aquimaris]SMX39506.1 hypothetical protein MAA8898_02040 [Maliponia aquimaris]
MAEPMVAHLYLYPDLRQRVASGRHGLLTTLCTLLRDQGWQVALCDDTPEALAAAITAPGHSLVRMITPPNAHGLTFRRTYYAPFWRIERSAERWAWPVARATFDPAGIDPAKAARFLGNMRERHFARMAAPTREGLVLIPLQGRLSEQRSFQACTPLQMIDHLLAHDPRRRLHATLHPREVYGPQDIAALDSFARRFPRFSYTRGGTETYLPACDYVATMNSSVALAGYFLQKPAVLFGQVDFHHIAARVHDQGIAEAVICAPEMTPDFAAYLWGFFRDMAIDDSRPDATHRIATALARGGWPVTAP